MTLEDIADLRRRHRAAVRARAHGAGYDLVYVYAAHNLSTLQHFLSPWSNLRDDDYGGMLANRARLLREVLEDTRRSAKAAPRSRAGSWSTNCTAPTGSSAATWTRCSS